MKKKVEEKEYEEYLRLKKKFERNRNGSIKKVHDFST